MAHAIEADVDVAVLPALRYGKGAAIGANGVGHVVFIGEPRRTVGHDAERRAVIFKRILRVAVQRLVPRLVVIQPPYLPARGHVDVRPRSVVEVLGAPAGKGLRRDAYPLELPLAVQRLVVRRQRQVVLGDVGLRGRRYGQRVCRFAVDTCCQGIVPLLAGLGRGGCRGQCGHHDDKLLLVVHSECFVQLLSILDAKVIIFS